jgi:hypothetical protein
MTRHIIAALLAAGPLAASAGDFPTIDSVSQEAFRGLSRDLGAAFSYKGVVPAAPLGTLGIDVGIEATTTKIEHGSAFSDAGAGGVSDVFVPKVHVHKGLPYGWDIGAFVGGASEVNATLFGADVRKVLVYDGIATPAIAVRLSGTRATGLGDLRIGTAAIDVMASKKFVVLTPYVGAGIVRTWSSVSNSTLKDEQQNDGRYFGGVAITLLAANHAFEAERQAGNTSLSAKLGLRF